MVRYSPTPIPKPPKTPDPIVITQFLGVDYNNDPTQINDRRSPDMQNMIINNQGVLDCRFGYSKVFTNVLGLDEWATAEWATALWGTHAGGTDYATTGLFVYNKTDGTDERLLTFDGQIETWDDSGDQPVSIYSGMAGTTVDSFQMGGKIYFMDGTNFVQYDGTTVSTVVSNAYVPTLTLGRDPTGGGTAFEDFNLLGAGFKDSFSTLGSATVYTLSLSGLDATLVTATVNGVAKVETTDFTVNRTTGVVTFSVAPTVGTDNVVITAYKTVAGFANRILNCKFSVLFGGANDTRVFVSGNPNYPYRNIDYRSGLLDPSYFPENGFTQIGSQAEAITAYTKQYDYLIVHKLNSTWNRTYSTDADGLAIFPIKPINDKIGALGFKSVALINNTPVTLDRFKGYHRLTQGTVRDERNYEHISLLIDNRLLKEADLENAIAFDYDGKMLVAVNGNVYVWDYEDVDDQTQTGEWFFWTNVYAASFLEYNGYLYFGDSRVGMIYKFKQDGETNAKEDDGEKILPYWKGKRFNMGAYSYRKNIDKVYLTLQPDSKASAGFYYQDDNVISDLVQLVDKYTYNYITYNYLYYTYKTALFPETQRIKIKSKKTIYFQPIIKNENLNESMGLSALEIYFKYVSEVK